MGEDGGGEGEDDGDGVEEEGERGDYQATHGIWSCSLLFYRLVFYKLVFLCFFYVYYKILLCITLVPRLISKREATPKKMLKSQVKKAKLESPAGLLLGKITTKNVGSHLSLVLYYFIACYKKK